MKNLQKHPVVFFFILTFLINWIGLALNIYGYFPPLGEWTAFYQGESVATFRTRQTLLSWSPNIAVIIVLALTVGIVGIPKLFRQFCIWRVGFKWWLVTLLFPIVLALITIGLHVFFKGELYLGGVEYLPIIFLTRNIFSLTTGSIGEEAGLRGFALPRLQNRFGALTASLIIGLLWGVMHLPIKMVKGATVEYFLFFVLTSICFSIILTWIYNSTKGSLLTIALAHNLVNATDASLSRSFAAIIPLGDYLFMYTFAIFIVSMLIAFGTKGRLGLVEGAGKS